MRKSSFYRCLLAVAAAVVSSLSFGVAASMAQAPAADVPCTSKGAGKYECGWWRPGNGIAGGSIVVSGGRTVGFLHQGSNWIVCQQKGDPVRDATGAENHWYGWTQADDNRWGWASALDARGGGNYGAFRGVPDCAGSHGPAPAGPAAGLWGTVLSTGGTTQPLPPPPPIGIDYSIYRGGQWLGLNDDDDRKGRGCTGAFPVRVGRRILGLTAGHCARNIDLATRVFREGGPFARFGTVQRNLLFTRHVDALVFGTGYTPGARWVQEIERGPNPPLKVDGHLRTEDQRRGLRVCLAGRNSGADQCGTVQRERTITLKGFPGIEIREVCTDINSQKGDSGGPVYTAPTGDHTRAVGIVSGGSEGSTCYQPIQAILDELGGLNRLPQPGEIR